MKYNIVGTNDAEFSAFYADYTRKENDLGSAEARAVANTFCNAVEASPLRKRCDMAEIVLGPLTADNLVWMMALGIELGLAFGQYRANNDIVDKVTGGGGRTAHC